MRRGARWLWAACLLAASCGGGSEPAVPTLERLRETGTVGIGYANEAPYAYRDTASGRVTGEAPEIARVVFERMGIPTVEGVLTEFGSLIPGLHAERFDTIAAGMYITPERCAQVAFSEPTFAVGEGLIVAMGNPLSLHSYEDIAATDAATIGVVAGAIERTYARTMNIPDDRIVTFPDAPAALAAVRAARVSSYAATALTVRDLLDKDPAGVQQAQPFTDPVIDGRPARGYGAFAFRPEDAALLAEFNRNLAAFIGSPEHQALVARFGFTPQELPGDVTTAELCGEP